MATRGLIGFKKGNKRKVCYNHYDSYPSRLGVSMVGFIKNTTVEEMNSIFDKIILVDEFKKATKEQADECAKYSDISVGSGDNLDWYCLLRKAQGSLEPYKNGLKYMIDGRDYGVEWEYTINLDSNHLEIYSDRHKIREYISFDDITTNHMYILQDMID